MSHPNAPWNGNGQTRTPVPLSAIPFTPLPIAVDKEQPSFDGHSVPSADALARPSEFTAPSNSLRVLIATQEFNEFRVLDRIYTEQPQLGIKPIGWCDNGLNLYQSAIDGDADVVIVDPETRSFQHEDIQRLWIYPKKPIVTIAAVPPQSGLANTMKQLGAVDLVTRPLTERSAHELVAKCHVGVQEALRYRGSVGYIPQMDSRTAQVIASRGWQQGVIVIWGPKGGVGKTTVAANLAVALGYIGNRRTVLVDANMAGGNDHHHFYQSIPSTQLGKNINALADRAMLNSRYGPIQPSATGMLGQRPILPADEVDAHLFRYGESQLKLLIGIPRQHMGGYECFVDENGRAFVRELFATLRQFEDFIIVDIGQDANVPVHLAALEFGDYVYVVVTPDRSSILATKEALDTLFRHVKLARSKFRLIINRYHESSGISRAEIVKALDMPEIATIPDGGPAVSNIVNSGKPLMVDHRGQVAESIISVASTIYPPTRDIWTNRGKLGKKPNAKNRGALAAIGAGLRWIVTGEGNKP
ncbi:MAG TPA: AAA family ATPase [Anaerolineae bacterium]|nr:AAA family ATPase [Anaerolineae bacterium]